MNLLSGEAKRRARRELEEQLRSISDRLDHLETTPAPDHDLERLRGLITGFIGETHKRLDGLDTALLEIGKAMERADQRMKDLTFGVAEGIERVARAERRIHATVKRARKELAERGFESPGLESEATELQLVDGGRSEDSGVQQLPEGVEQPADEPSSIRGVSAAHLRRVRGF